MSTNKTSRAIVAVVDDEPLILESWKEALADKFDVKIFSDPLAADRYFESHDVDVALLDVRMPGLDGLALLERLKTHQPTVEAIIITGHGSIEIAVQAIRDGAYDFLCKPVENLESAIRRIESAVERKRLCESNVELRSRLHAFEPSTELIGESRSMAKVRSLIAQVAGSTAPVLICGESGTGKELVARALHLQSTRAGKPLVAINCAAMTETLIDSELFGHERGAFTGAQSSHKGLFEAADGGVLFLDEIGDVPLQTQVRLLRALQEGEIRPVGATRSRTVDVRVVAATNVNLERAMREGRFREDLYYRISTFRIDLPTLRERRDDIPVIAHHLLRNHTKRADREIAGFTDDTIAALVAYDWPGNVRELNNAIEHATVLCQEGLIDVTLLPSFVTSGLRQRSRPQLNDDIGSASSVPFGAARSRLLEAFEKRYLDDLLMLTSGNLSEASRRSGIDRSNLRRMLRRHSIQPSTFRPAS
ncbi:MAG: sigma-54 dependent transcriptional regulator [Myxococcota bacterium]